MLLYLLFSAVAFLLLQVAVYAVLVVFPRRKLRHRPRDRLQPDRNMLDSFEAEARKKVRTARVSTAHCMLATHLPSPIVTFRSAKILRMHCRTLMRMPKGSRVCG
jgi:hypothetical protein